MFSKKKKHIKKTNLIQLNKKCFTAIKNSNSKKLDKYLYQGADVNALNKNGETLFYCACKKNDINVITTILDQKNLKITASDSRNYTPLHIACEHNLIRIVQKLLDRAPETINLCNERLETPFFIALKQNNPDLIKLLFSIKNIKINHQNCSGDTLLHLACLHINWSQIQPFNIIKQLIKKGANPFIKNKEQLTPLTHFLWIINPNNIPLPMIISLSLQNIHNIVDYKCKIFNEHNNERSEAIQILRDALYILFYIESPYIECALFKAVLTSHSNLPYELKQFIMCFYYLLNIEKIMTKKCLSRHKHVKPNMHELRKQLLTKLEPKLLWNEM